MTEFLKLTLYYTKNKTLKGMYAIYNKSNGAKNAVFLCLTHIATALAALFSYISYEFYILI